MRLLVVNPNTTASMTDTIERAAHGAAAPGTEIIAVTSIMGPVSIEGYYDEVFAIPGLLKEIAAGELAGAQAAVIACFDDTGLDAARAMAFIPVVGICESALAMAAFVARRISIITPMDRSRVPIEELVRRYGMASRVRVRAIDVPVLSLEDPSSGAIDRLRHEIADSLSRDQAEAIILGCAGLAALAASLSREFDVPVIDGVTAAVKQAEALVSVGLKTAKRGAYASPVPKPYLGILGPFAPAGSP